MFIQLTLQQEQEEYEREGIQWEPIEYFDNKIICDLVEEKHKGIIAILVSLSIMNYHVFSLASWSFLPQDEECLRPGEATDLTFLQKLEQTVGSHRHFITHKATDNKTRKTIARDVSTLVYD